MRLPWKLGLDSKQPSIVHPQAGPSRRPPTPQSKDATATVATDEKGADLVEVDFDTAKRQFWVALRSSDVASVSNILGTRPVQERLKLSKEPERAGWQSFVNGPQRPLCVAAFQGPKEMCMTLLEGAPENVRLADKNEA